MGHSGARGSHPMKPDLSSIVVAVVFLAVAVLVVAVLVIKRAERSSDVLRGGYIERDSDGD